MIAAADRKFGFGFGERTEGMLVLHLRFARQHIQANSFQARSRAREIGVHQFFVQSDRFENLGALIALQRRDAHLRESLQQAFIHRLDEVLDRNFGGNAVGQILRARPDLPRSRCAR